MSTKKYTELSDDFMEAFNKKLGEGSCGSIHSSYKKGKKVEEDQLDPVDKKAVKKDFDDRKDQDIDNDGDVDSTDKYLHKRRKAISKAIQNEEAEIVSEESVEIAEEDDDDDEEDEESEKCECCGNEITDDGCGCEDDCPHCGGKGKVAEEVELDESVKVSRADFDKLKKGSMITIDYGSSIKGSTTRTFQVKSKTRSAKYNVDKVNMIDPKRPGGMKFHLYSRDGQDATLALGDMGATIKSYSIKESVELDEASREDKIKQIIKIMKKYPANKGKSEKELRKGAIAYLDQNKESVELDEKYSLNELSDKDIKKAEQIRKYMPGFVGDEFAKKASDEDILSFADLQDKEAQIHNSKIKPIRDAKKKLYKKYRLTLKESVEEALNKLNQDFPNTLNSLEEKRDAGKSATGYDIYHDTYSAAMQHAYAHAKKKHGVTVRPSEIDDKVASGPRKPSSGKTVSHILKTDKKQNLHVQVYNTGRKYELNMYVEEVELDEAINYMKVSKELDDYAKKHGGMDKREFEKAAAYVREIGRNSSLSVQDKAGKGLNMLFKNADTDVRDRLQMILTKGGFKVKGGYVMRESVELDEANAIDLARDVVKNKGAKKGLDVQTANAILTVYNKVNDANKKKMETMPVKKLAMAAWKILGKAEEFDIDEDALLEVFSDKFTLKDLLNVDIQEKAVSQAQQKLMGMALAYKRGEMDDASDEVKKVADSMSEKDLEDFAKTKHKGLPDKKEGYLKAGYIKSSKKY